MKTLTIFKSILPLKHVLFSVSAEVNNYGADQDLLVCAVISHGTDDDWIATKKDGISIDDVCRVFNASNCPALAGKPKIVFRYVGLF